MTNTNISLGRRTNYRYVVLVFLLSATFMNYLDRTALSVTAGRIKKDLNITDYDMGWLLSAFGWGILITILFSAFLLQKMGAQKFGTISLGGFSLMTLLTVLAGNFGALFAFRLGLGVFEGPTFPINAYMARRWFPKRERAKAVGIYMSASFLGFAFGTPMLIWIMESFNSWQSVFIFAGILGMIPAALWYVLVSSDPSQSRFVSKAELEHIRSDQDEEEAKAVDSKERLSGRDWLAVLTNRRMLGLYVGAFATSTVVFFFLTWFPVYMTDELKFNFKSGGFLLTALPYISGMLGMLFAGWFSDRLIKNGMPQGKARKVTVTVGLLGVVLLLIMPLFNGASSTVLLIIVMVVFFFAGMANTAWLLASEVAAPRLLGLTVGIYGLFVNAFGAITPVIIGKMLDVTGRNWGIIFMYIGFAAVLGVIAYVFLIDRVESMPDPKAVR